MCVRIAISVAGCGKYKCVCVCVGGGHNCLYLAVAVAGQLRDKAHVILSDLDHLLTYIVLWAAACRCARPPEGRKKKTEKYMTHYKTTVK